MQLLPGLGIALLSLAAALAPALLIGCDDANPRTPTAPSLPEHKQQIRVTGRVVDFTTRGGVAGMPLRWSSGLTTVASLVTDANGFYEVRVPFAPRYQVESPLEPIPRILATVLLPAISLTVEQNFYINPGECHALYGRVLDGTTRAPVSGALVSWAGGSANTNADGTYMTLDDCRPRPNALGTTTATVSHTAYVPFFTFFIRAESLRTGFISQRDFELTPRAP
jgi:hypothetical protein